MLIRFIPPSESEAEMETKENGEIAIKPRFAAASGSANFGSLVIVGRTGRERRFILQVSGKLGRVSACEARNIEPDFDKKDNGSEVTRGKS